MFKLSMKLLRNEYKKAILYGVTTTLAVTIVFLYLNVFYLLKDLVIEATGSALLAVVNPAIIVVFLITCLCCAMLVLASNYYLNSKSKEYATLLLSGKNAIEVGMYSLFQCIIIVGVSIVLGISVSYQLVPIVNQAIYDYLGVTSNLQAIAPNAVKETSYIIILILIIILLMFSGYAYRHTILKLLVNEKNVQGMHLTKFKNRDFLRYVYLFAIVLILTSNSKSGAFTFPILISAYPIYYFYRNKLPTILRTYRKEQGLESSVELLSIAHLGSTIQSCSGLTTVLMILMPLFLSILHSTFYDPTEFIVLFIGYHVIMILLSVSLLYQYMTSIQGRKHTFNMLPKLGYTTKTLKKAIKQEVRLFYSLLIVLPSLFPIIMLVKVFFYDIAMFQAIGIAALSYIVLMISSYIFIRFYYLRIIK